MLLDNSFFTGELHIEGLVDYSGVPSETNCAIAAEMYSLISYYEMDFYRRTIGNENAKLFIKYLDEQHDSVCEKWEGLKNMLVDQVGNRVISPIANYVFFFYLRSNQTQATPIGNVTETSSNDIAPCNIKMMQAWNQMADMNQYLSRYLFQNKDDFGGYFFDEHLLEYMNQIGV